MYLNKTDVECTTPSSKCSTVKSFNNIVHSLMKRNPIGEVPSTSLTDLLGTSSGRLGRKIRTRLFGQDITMSHTTLKMKESSTL